MSCCHEFPVCLPNPEHLYMPDPPFVPYVDPLAHPPSPVPRVSVLTFPRLFDAADDGPMEGFNYILMGDKLLLQALFAAGQFLTARCKEQGLVGMSEANPFIAAEQGSHNFACLYAELSLLGANLGHLMSEMALSPRKAAAQAAYQHFTTDLGFYAPWLKYPEGASSFWALIQRGHAKLREAQQLAQAHLDARQHFEHERRV